MFDKQLDLHTTGLGQWFVAIVASLCPLTAGQLMAWPTVVQPKIKRGEAGFTLSQSEYTWLAELAFISNIVSPIPSGRLMDRIGRRNTIRIGLVIAIATWVIKSLRHDFPSLFLARFLSGLWLGIVYTVIPAFLAEVVKPEIRGAMGALFGVNLYLGALYDSLASLTTYQNFNLISTVAPTIVFICFLFVPESPYYYLQNGDRENAKASILWLQGKCNDDDLSVLQAKVEDQLKMKGTFCDIFKTKANRKAFFIVEFLTGVQRFSGGTFLFTYTTEVVPDSWVPSEHSFLVLNIVWIVFSILCTFIIDKFNRRTMLAVCCLGSGLGNVALTIWYYMRDFTDVDTSTSNFAPLLLLIFSGMFYATGIISIPTMVQAELYPVKLKSIGSAVACMSGSIFSTLTIKFYDIINKHHIGVYFNFVIMAVAPLLCLVFIYTVMVETKGKSLEDIQDMLNPPKIATVAPSLKMLPDVDVVLSVKIASTLNAIKD